MIRISSKMVYQAFPGLILLTYGIVLGAEEPAPMSLPPRPTMIYVTDFELDAKNIESEHPASRTGPLSRIRARWSGGDRNPAEQARDLVERMASLLVEDLREAGFEAERLETDASRPQMGVIVRGVFTQVEEGGRIRRAVVGFGAGGTDLQLVVSLYDATKGDPQPLYQFDAHSEGRKKPGAIIMLNPYVAAAKFVMSGHDLEKNVERAASDVAKDIAKRYQPMVDDGK